MREEQLKNKKKEPGYFEEALSDFLHDAASGGAIRHLVDLGYTTDQIMERLDFPTPRARVERAVSRYMMETEILLEKLPQAEAEYEPVLWKGKNEAELCAVLRKKLGENGEENSYVACPFGMIRRDREKRLEAMLSCLTGRERSYLLGIDWGQQVMYHRLNSRMMEIGIQLGIHGTVDMEFYFLKKKEKLLIWKNKERVS